MQPHALFELRQQVAAIAKASAIGPVYPENSHPAVSFEEHQYWQVVTHVAKPEPGEDRPIEVVLTFDIVAVSACAQVAAPVAHSHAVSHVMQHAVFTQEMFALVWFGIGEPGKLAFDVGGLDQFLFAPGLPRPVSQKIVNGGRNNQKNIDWDDQRRK